MAPEERFRKLLKGLRRRPDAEARAEIESHLQMQADELIAAGMSAADADAEARRRFGNVEAVHGECRELQQQIQRRRTLLVQVGSLRGDVRYALRSLRHAPGFALFAVATLALGIGGATAVFSVASGLFLAPLPGVRDASTVVELTQGHEGDFVSVSYPVFRAISDGVDELEAVAGVDLLSVAIGDGDRSPVVTMGMQVTDGYFETLGTRPALGRLFHADEASYPAVASVAVISHALWQRRFGGDPGILGSSVRFNGTPLQIVGVTEAGFHGHAVALQVDVFVPIGSPVPGVHGSASLDGPRNGVLDMVGRLAPGATIDQAAAAADAVSDRYVQAIEGADATYPIRIVPYGSVPGPARTGVAAFLAALLLVVMLVLAITCVNITNLQLSRASRRAREIAVRMSLGAGRGRVIRQLVVESLVVFVLGATVGVLGATWAVRLASQWEPPIPIPGARVALDLAVDGPVLLFALATTLLAGLLSGLVAGVHAVRCDPVAGLRDGAGSITRPQRASSILVAAQAAATVVLLVVAGLFLRSFRASQSVDLGFDSTRVVVATFDMEMAGFGALEGAQFWERLLDYVSALPAVESASLAHKLPISSRSQTVVSSPGVEPPEGARGFLLSNRRVSNEYFETLGYRIVRGRGFARTDAAGAPPVIIVNETMAKLVWPGQDPVGRVLDNGREQYEVIGIAADAVYHDPHEPTPAFGFFPLAQNYDSHMVLHARLRNTEPATVAAFHDALRDLDPLVPVTGFAMLDDALALNFIGDLLGASLSASFGVLGLLLAAFGVYGVTSFWAAQRRGEIGLRLALGATSEGVVRWTVRRGLRAPALGLGAGLLLALGAARLLGSVVSGISSFDPTTFVAVTAGLVAIGVVATWLPARAAARVDPAETLRSL